jgi:hypothetical protein
VAPRMRGVSQGSAVARQPFVPPPPSHERAPAGVSSHVRVPGRLARAMRQLDRLDGRVLLLAIGLELLIALWLLVPRAGVASAGAGFGEYAASLLAGNGYRMQVPCGQLDVARRLPLQPLFLAAVGWLGGGLWSAVLARGALLAALCGLSISRFAAERGVRWWQSRHWTLLLAVLCACPMFAKHLSQLSYEEGWSIVLVPCLLVAGMAVVDPSPNAARSRGAWSLALGVLAAAIFLLKSTYLPLHLCACAALAWACLRHRSALAGIGLLLGACAPLGWLAFVHARTGQLSLGSSWDGENLYRGLCEACARVSPTHSLDRLFDTPLLSTPSGPVTTDVLPPRCAFHDEWSWHAAYRERALAAAQSSGSGTLGYLARKLGVVFLEVRPVPHLGAGGWPRLLTVLPSFVLARGALAIALVQGFRQRAELRRLTPPLFFGAAVLLASIAPLIVGFAYDRHTLVVLVTGLFFAAAITTMLQAGAASER